MDKQQVPKQVAVSGFQCGFCGTLDNVSWYCCTCPGALCSECSTRHSTDPAMPGHTISSIFCAQHPDEVSSVCCTDCQRTSCLSCSAENHSSHKVTLLSQARVIPPNNQYPISLPPTFSAGAMPLHVANLSRDNMPIHGNQYYPPSTTSNQQVLPQYMHVGNTFTTEQPQRPPFHTKLAYILGVTSCLFCVWPVGLCAILAAFMSQRLWIKHNDAWAVRCKKISYILSAVSVVIGICIIIVYIVLSKYRK